MYYDIWKRKTQIAKVIPNPLNCHLRTEIIFNLGTWYIIENVV